MIPSLIVAFLAAVLAAVFALENALPVTVTFLSFKFSGSLAAVLMIVFGFGVLAALAAVLPALFSAKWQVRSLKRRFEPKSPPTVPPVG